MQSIGDRKKIALPSYISSKRVPVDSPEWVVNDGISCFGTFKTPLQHVNLNSCRKPCGKYMPDFLKPFRLKQWFAYLIDFNKGFILSAVYDTGPLRFNVISFFDKETRKAQSNMVFTLKKRDIFPETLIDSKICLQAGHFSQEIVNALENGKIDIKAFYPGDKKHFSYRANVALESVSIPSIVVMPLGENKPLYIHKELFKATGQITVGKREFKLDEKAICAIDDHKGYYPYHMEYDWVAGFRNDERGTLAFNLVDNQVLNPDDYNENFIWINGEMHQLPPVKVSKKTDTLWFVNDVHGAVDLRFEIEDDFTKKISAPFFKADYRAPYGKISGTIIDLEGVQHSLEGTFGIGEDLNYRY